MTTSEFTVWFDGFRAGIDNAPTPEQWQLLCEQIEQLRSDPPQWQLQQPWTLPLYPFYDPLNPIWA